MSEPNLVTTSNFHGKEYLVKMNVISNCLELVITDKHTGEEWQCSYDMSYIENLTHKTGNYKQFDIFTTMLKSGLLKTSDCISLDFLTFEDLEVLRSKRAKCYTSRSLGNNHYNNRRYLILTYSVEFDRINYPLPLEYCGPPNPAILQATIRRLESELGKAKDHISLNLAQPKRSDSKHTSLLQKRVDELTTENLQLREEIRQLTKAANKKTKTSQLDMLHKAIASLEKSVLLERNSHHELVEKLKNDKLRLMKELEKYKTAEKSLRLKLQKSTPRSPSRNNYGDNKKKMPAVPKSERCCNMIYRRAVWTRNTVDQNYSRSRSVSPKPTKSENWNQEQHGFPSTRSKKPRNRSRSRSSSVSSAIFSEKDYHVSQTNVLQQKKQSVSPSRRASSLRIRSRSNSATSNTSSKYSHTSERKTPSSGAAQIKSVKNDMEFRNIEGRIQALQKLLKEGMKF